jgi:hypothetical protein
MPTFHDLCIVRPESAATRMPANLQSMVSGDLTIAFSRVGCSLLIPRQLAAPDASTSYSKATPSGSFSAASGSANALMLIRMADVISGVDVNPDGFHLDASYGRVLLAVVPLPLALVKALDDRRAPRY